MMTRWLSILSVLLCGTATGCSMLNDHGSAADATTSPVISRILRSGELRVGTSGSQPPLNATAKDGTIIGFDMDLAAQLAGAMGVKLKVVPMPFADLLPAVQKGEVDMVLSGLSMTPERNLRVAFVGPYLVSGMSILTKSKTMAKLRRAEEMDVPTIKVAALRSSTAVTFAQQTIPQATLVLVGSLDEGVEMVRAGTVDALLADHPFCSVTVYRYRGEDLSTLETPFTFEPLGIALPPNDPLLVNWTQNALADMDDSGAVYDMMYQWFEEDDWLQRLK